MNNTASPTAHAQTNLWLVLSLLVLASGISIMSTDLYTPSLPHLPEFFGATPQAVKLTITLNVLGFGFAQLGTGQAALQIR